MDAVTRKRLTGFLGRAFLVCVLFQCVAIGGMIGLGDWAYSIHSELFGLSRGEFGLVAYVMVGLIKVLSVTLFLAPWVALKWSASDEAYREMLDRAVIEPRSDAHPAS